MKFIKATSEKKIIRCFKLGMWKQQNMFCFRFQLLQLLSSKCFRFHKNLTASTAFASSFRFHIPTSCFMKNASASGSSKSQMLPSSLPASIFKVLPLPQKFNCFHSFHFQLPLPHPSFKSNICILINTFFYKHTEPDFWWKNKHMLTIRQS